MFLYRPVGLEELKLIAASNFRAFPPRLPEQPIFYPVLLMRNNKNKERSQKQLIEMSFQAGRSVVVDNTNPTIETRSSLIQIGRAYNAEIIGYYLASDLNLCLERNSKRSGKAKIPDIGIHATFKKLVMPSYEEGFDRLFYVAIAAKEKFKIRDWL